MSETTIGYRGEIKILRVLLKKRALNITALAKEIGHSNVATKRHAYALERKGFVKVKSYGAVQIVTLNEENPKFQAVKQLWGEESQ